MKVCGKCKIEKDISEFSNHKSAPDGKQWWCKKCLYEYTSAYLKTPKGKDIIARFKKDGRNTAYQKKYYSSEKGLLASKNNKERNRDKYKARTEVYKAILRGDMKVPARCKKCNKKTKLQGHHYLGYEPEHWLHVIFLCKRCHMEEDGII